MDDDHVELVNCGPWSVVITAGTPYLEIHMEVKAVTQAAAEVSDIGIVSGQCVHQSTIVRRYVAPAEN